MARPAHLARSARAARARARTLRRSAERAALAASDAPLSWLARLLALNLAAAGAFTVLGLAVGDQALLFRELAPGTLLSFVQLAFLATAAWLVHLHASPGRAWHADVWGVAAGVFGVFAFDEIAQTSQFLGTWLNEGLGLEPASGFNDVGAVILTLAFAGAALALLPRAFRLVRQPAVLGLIAAAATLAVASQALDSFVTPTRWEFVAEESLKLAAEAVMVGALLCALRDARGIRRG